ncbi:hypothetical protein DFLDMN_000801 [Cupriavidus sp. H19C3]|nr:MAG: DUF1120 domain-containing protein [Cupriavidus sp.]
MTTFRLATCCVLFCLSTNTRAENVTLRITGTIQPAACMPTVVGVDSQNAIHYGTIAVPELEDNKFKALPDKTITLLISCDAPTRVAVNFLDNRSDSMIMGLSASIGPYGDVGSYGLGMHRDKRLGGYVIVPELAATADGSPVVPAWSTMPGKWNHYHAAGANAMLRPNIAHAWTSGKGVIATPDAYQQITQKFTIKAALQRKNKLQPITGPIELDGQTTISLFYF